LLTPELQRFDVSAWISCCGEPPSPYSADFDGDGKDEKIVWRPSQGNWYVRFSGSDDAMVYQWGLPGDIPLVGDYDGVAVHGCRYWRHRRRAVIPVA
jgi:hypothetical protein